MAVPTIFAPCIRSSVSLYLALTFLQVGASSIAGFILSIWSGSTTITTALTVPTSARTTSSGKLGSRGCYWIVASLLAAFTLSLMHISQVWDTTCGTFSAVASETHSREEEDDSFPAVKAFKRALQSVNNTALLVDAAILVVFLLAYTEYSQNIILGPVIPYCTLFRFSPRRDDEYWKSLRMLDKECIISQCA
ncbi:hypothetical protein BU16DRAFT_617743 [Lophium mytilinum]|uniref:Uncharacterized protein n=1 Tax=Lophium mytilinum TaxID=390894 RepID=A0A6A6QYX1_9PEZI|nr:hypothetical protein BU16DRAFT_617743 [Lophium mytilinum]